MRSYYETMRNAEKYYRSSSYNYVARMLDGDGFTARIDTNNRAYNVITRVEKETEMVIMEFYPGIHCSNETRSQTAEYISKINNKYKICNIRISSIGNIHIHTEQRIDNAPVTAEMFKKMEIACINILNTFESVIEKLAYGRLIEPEEADVEVVILEKHLKKFRKSMEFDAQANDEDEKDAVAEAEDSEKLSPSERWMRERKEKAENGMSEKGESFSFESVKEETSEKIDFEENLLAALLAEEDDEEEEKDDD